MRGRSSDRQTNGRLLVERGGSAAVEMAILLPVFLTFLLGIAEVARAVDAKHAAIRS